MHGFIRKRRYLISRFCYIKHTEANIVLVAFIRGMCQNHDGDLQTKLSVMR